MIVKNPQQKQHHFPINYMSAYSAPSTLFILQLILSNFSGGNLSLPSNYES